MLQYNSFSFANFYDFTKMFVVLRKLSSTKLKSEGSNSFGTKFLNIYLGKFLGVWC